MRYLVVGLSGLIAIFIIFVFYSLGVFSFNKAQKDFRPMSITLKQLGAKKLCDNGDNGKGIDNNAPWYEAYYSVNKTPELESRINSAAKTMGYNLGPGDKTGGQGYDNSTYLVSYAQRGKLSVRIAYSGDQVPLYCGTGSDYGKSAIPDANEAVLDIQLSEN